MGNKQRATNNGHTVQRTHENLRTLTCLSRSLSLASRLEHSNQTNNSRRWPSVPCFPRAQIQDPRPTGRWSWLRFACSVPHSPSTWVPAGLDRGGGCRRYDCEVPQRNWPMLRKALRMVIAVPSVLLSATGRLTANLHGDGFRIRAEPTKNSKVGVRGQVSRPQFGRRPVSGAPHLASEMWECRLVPPLSSATATVRPMLAFRHGLPIRAPA
jgi:hypothetical protein